MKTIKILLITLTCSFALSLTAPTSIPFAKYIAFIPTVSAASPDAAPPEIRPTSHTIVWKYKLQNGVMYKRKYDRTADKWIGDWIRA